MIYYSSSKFQIGCELCSLRTRIRVETLSGSPEKKFKITTILLKVSYLDRKSAFDAKILQIETRYTFCSAERGSLPHCCCVYCGELRIDLAKISLGLYARLNIRHVCAHDSSVTRWTYGASPAVYLLTYL